MADDQQSEDIFEGVGDPAREKTLGEQPVSDQDIEEIHDDIADVEDDLAELQSRGDGAT